MSQKRANLEFGWATIAGIAGWMGTVGGILTWIALFVFVAMAALIAFTIIHSVFFRGRND